MRSAIAAQAEMLDFRLTPLEQILQVVLVCPPTAERRKLRYPEHPTAAGRLELRVLSPCGKARYDIEWHARAPLRRIDSAAQGRRAELS